VALTTYVVRNRCHFSTPFQLFPVEIRTGRRPFQSSAVCVERRPVHHGITGSAMPTGVPAAAVTEASDMSHEDLIRAERVPVRAPGRRAGDPLPGGLYQFAQAQWKLTSTRRPAHSICSRFFSFPFASTMRTVRGFPPMAGAMRSAMARIPST
jgi:hypothetical protein